MIKLQFKDRRRESVWLVDELFSIGKSTINSLIIEDPSIEARHAEITNTGNTLTINKKVPGASIKINGTEITQASPIKENDTITLGKVELELIDSKSLIASNTNKTKTSHIWSLHSNASWLEKNDFIITKKTIIGRDPQCDICLTLDYLSRQHVSLEPFNGKLIIEDLNSSNGTYVNGSRINKTELKPGDKIKLDVLTFEVRGPSGKSNNDPNKTIIRNAPPTTKKQDSQTKSPQIKVQQNAISSSSNSKQLKRKRLASDGKQAWISGDNQLKAKTEKNKGKTGLLFTIIALTIVAGGLLFVFTQ